MPVTGGGAPSGACEALTAALHLVECGFGATCSFAVGESIPLPRRQLLIGRVPDADVVITSIGQGGRKNCTVTPVGTGHSLTHLRHGNPIHLNGQPFWDEVLLRDRDRISPGANLVFEYRNTADFPAIIGVVGNYLLFSAGRVRTWRTVPLADLGSPPFAACIVPTGTTPRIEGLAPRGVIRGRDSDLGLYDDFAGVTVDDVITASVAAGVCDTAIAASLIVGSFDSIGSGVVGFDGVVRYVGGLPELGGRRRALRTRPAVALNLIELLTPHEHIVIEDADPDSTRDALARDAQESRSLLERARRVPDIGDDLAASILADVNDVNHDVAVARERRLHAWAQRQAPGASNEMRRSLLEAFFAADCADELRLREELGLLSVGRIEGMMRSVAPR